MKVLVICAHPDDEVIAIGGTLRKLANAGADIRLVIISAGAEGYADLNEKKSIVSTRNEETQKVCDILGIQEYYNLDAMDWSIKVDNESYHSVIHHIRKFKPNLIFTHSRGDYNDHMAVHDVVTDGWFHAGIPCAMSEGELWNKASLYEFEVLKPLTEPTDIVDISETYSAKVEAMKCYASQHEVVGGIFQLMEGRALERGSRIAVKYGEALMKSSYRPRAIHNINTLLEL